MSCILKQFYISDKVTAMLKISASVKHMDCMSQKNTFFIRVFIIYFKFKHLGIQISLKHYLKPYPMADRHTYFCVTKMIRICIVAK